MRSLAILVGSAITAGSLIFAGPALASPPSADPSAAAAAADASGGIGKIGLQACAMTVVHTQDDDRGIDGAKVDKSGFQRDDTAAPVSH